MRLGVRSSHGVTLGHLGQVPSHLMSLYMMIYMMRGLELTP